MPGRHKDPSHSPRRSASPHRRDGSRGRKSVPRRGSVFGLPLSNREDHRHYQRDRNGRVSHSRSRSPSISRRGRDKSRHSRPHRHEIENSPPRSLHRSPPIPKTPHRSPSATRRTRSRVRDPQPDPDDPPAELYDVDARAQCIYQFRDVLLDFERVKASSGKKKYVPSPIFHPILLNDLRQTQSCTESS